MSWRAEPGARPTTPRETLKQEVEAALEVEVRNYFTLQVTVKYVILLLYGEILY